MSMYSRGKSGPVPSDAQAREKLIVYVYEYLHHAGAPGAAEKFLQEIQWAKGQITPNEAPGFLHSWWCVFWDLYCAAPERRDNFPHSKEASSFHDYSVMTSTGYPMSPNLNGMGMPPGAGQPPHHPHALRMRRILEDKAQGRAAETQTVQMDHFVRLRRLIKMPVGLTVGGITAIDSCYAFSDASFDTAGDLFINLARTIGTALVVLMAPVLSSVIPSIHEFMHRLQPLAQKHFTNTNKIVLSLLAVAVASLVTLLFRNQTMNILRRQASYPVIENQISAVLGDFIPPQGRFAFTILVYAVWCWTSCQAYTMQTAITVIAVATGLVFREIVTVLQRSSEENSRQYYFQQYCDLKSAVRQLNTKASSVMLYLHFYGACWILYGVISLRRSRTSSFVVFILIQVVGLVGSTMACAFLHSQAVKIRRFLEDKAQAGASKTEAQQISDCVRFYRVSNTPAGLTVGGITVINSRYAFSGLGLLITFILLTY